MYTRLATAPTVSLLIELNKRTGYLDCFAHAGGKAGPRLRVETQPDRGAARLPNLGLTRMVEASGISDDILV